MTTASHFATDVLDGLRSRPGRTAIAFAGVTVGLFALTLTLGVLRGFQERARQLTAELGAHAAALLQAPDVGSRDPAGRLARRHIEALCAAAPDGIWSGLDARPIDGPDGRQSLWLVRTDEFLAAARSWRMTEGRFLDPVDVRDGAAHAVATEAAVHAFGWRPGESIPINGHLVRLIGIVSGGEAPAEPATGVVGSTAPALFIPWTSAIPGTGGEREDRIGAIHLAAGSEAGLRRAIAIAQRILAAPDLAPADTAWVTPESLLRGLRRWRTGVVWGTGLLAGLCLLLGGSSLMGLLLSDVRNRMPEIGLRLSLGARPPDIAALFLAEALLVTAVAAAAALIAAWPVLALLSRQTAIPFDLHGPSVLIVLGAALVFGTAFSYVPARLASRTPAAAALRND